MANVKLLFYGTKETDTESCTVETYCSDSGALLIEITDVGHSSNYVCLDKQTAIKLVKTLKSEIAKMQY
jgi:hypothetical protein